MVAPAGEPLVLPPGEHAVGLDEVEGLLERLRTPLGARERLTAALKLLRAAGCAQAWLGGPLIWSQGANLGYRIVWDPHDVDPERLDSVFLNSARDFALLRQHFGGAFEPGNAATPRGEALTGLFSDDQDEARPVLRIVLTEAQE